MSRTGGLRLTLRVKGEFNPGTFSPPVAQPAQLHHPHNRSAKAVSSPRNSSQEKSSPGLEWRSPAHLGRRDSSTLRC